MDRQARCAPIHGSQRVRHDGATELNWTVQSPSHVQLFVTHALQHTRPPCPSHLPRFARGHAHCIGGTIQPPHSLTPPSFCLQSFPALGSFPTSQLFTSDDQNTGVITSASVLPTSIQSWFPLRLTVLISLQSKRLSRAFSNITVQKHQFYSILL